MTLDASGIPDLEVTTDDILIYPPSPIAGGGHCDGGGPEQGPDPGGRVWGKRLPLGRQREPDPDGEWIGCQVETRALNQAVRRNIDRFPEDFMFRLTREEMMWISQTVIST